MMKTKVLSLLMWKDMCQISDTLFPLGGNVLFKNRKNSKAFKKAQESAGDEEIVGGTYDSNGEPLYFTAPRGATEEEIRDLAFASRNGRPMSNLENGLLSMAEERKR